MKKIPVYNKEGEIIGEEVIELPDEKVNKDVIYYYVNAYLANQRIGTASTKTRGEVSGGGKKPWRQKGTGRARVGSIRNPIWRGGGVVFGPKPRDYRINLPKKMKRKALVESIKDKILNERISLFDFSDLNEIKTKIMYNFLKKLGFDTEKILFVLNKEAENRDKIIKSIRNLSAIEYDYADQVNPYEILKADRILVDKKGFEHIKKKIEESKNGS